MQNNNLKTRAVSRIILDMIETVKQKDSDSSFIILVLDEYTTKILSFYLTMSEVLNLGIFNIEPLNIKRKAYPTYSVIYFISPCRESCELLSNDFIDNNDPKYGNVHIFFSSRLLDTQLNILVNDKLAWRVRSLKELNVSFFATQNCFDLRVPSLQMFALSSNNFNDERSLILHHLKDKLLTVMVSLKEFPYIQYQGTKLCEELASKVNASLNELNELKLLKPERKSICLILDRTVDMVTPVLHDYSYKALIYDFFDVDENSFLSIPSEDIKDHKLDDKDTIWSKYKNCHIGEVLKNIQDDVDEFKKSDLAQQDQNNLDNFDDMIKAVQGVKGYREKHKQLNIHLKLCNKILKVILQFIYYATFDIILILNYIMLQNTLLNRCSLLLTYMKSLSSSKRLLLALIVRETV